MVQHCRRSAPQDENYTGQRRHNCKYHLFSYFFPSPHPSNPLVRPCLLFCHAVARHYIGRKLTQTPTQILFSFSTSLLLTFAPDALPSVLRYSLSPVLLIATLFARSHIAGFWEHKAKVPFVDGYNEAIGSTVQILDVLKWLEYSWVGVSLVGAIAGY